MGVLQRERLLTSLFCGFLNVSKKAAILGEDLGEDLHRMRINFMLMRQYEIYSPDFVCGGHKEHSQDVCSLSP